MFNRRSILKLVSSGVPLGLAQDAPAQLWDVHCHLNSVPGETPEARMGELVKFMDRLGIERVMVSMGYPLLENPPPQALRDQNDQVLRAVRGSPGRAFGFVYLNPNHIAASLKEFDRCVRDGPMVGVKLWVARHCNAPELDPIVERAVSMQAPILQHTWLKVSGNLPGESTPFDIVELAKRHPGAMLICGHTGGDWERGIRAVRSSKNVSVEIAGSDPTSGIVEMALRQLGPGRILFGSDGAGRSFASQLGKVMGAEIPPALRKLILGGNLRRMLTPILRAKGYPV
jgi:predicted TIM-barrel fold metal-dependent hydrolase